MTPEKLKEVEKIYHSVLEVPIAKRALIIKELCGVDIELRREVESLLAFDKTSDNLIDCSPKSFIQDIFSSPPTETSRVNQKIGHYQITRLLGKGGMGEVYLAQDQRLNRKVALKFLSENINTDQSRLHRFEREALAASALNHPNILTIYEFSAESETHFLAAEFVEGETLRDALNSRKLSLKEILNIAEQLASALVVAHKAGIIHRDIKPENVMLREDGLIKVLDFGLAKLIGTQNEEISDPVQPPSDNPPKSVKKTQFTTSGILMGTVVYMSPEQTRGRNIDHRSDIWSFGVVLYEMLTGKTPFAGENSTEVISTIAKGEFLPIKNHLPDIPSELERIIEKSICVERKDRYQNIDELLIDLRNLKDEWYFQTKFDKLQVSHDTDADILKNTKQFGVQQTDGSHKKSSVANKISTNSGAAYFVETIKKGKYRSAGALFALSLLLISGFVYFKYYSDYFQPALFKTVAEPISQTRIQTVGAVIETAISPDGKLLLYTATDTKKYSLRINQLEDKRTITVISDSDFLMSEPTFSPDGKNIYYLASNNPDFSGYDLYRVAIEGGTPQKIIDDVDTMVSFSPDGNEIAFKRNFPQKNESHIIIAKIDGSAERGLAVRLFDDESFNNNPVWSPDGKTIVVVASEKTDGLKPFLLFAINVADGSITKIGSTRWRWTTHLQWVEGGKELLLNATDKPGGFTQFWRVSYPEGKVVKVTDDFNKYQGASLNADGTLLATTLIRQNVDVFVTPLNNISESKKIRSIAGTSYYGFDWTPDGKLVFSTNAGGNRDLWMMGADGSHPHQLTNDDFVNELPVVTPDGRYIVYVSEKAGMSNIWRMNIDGSNPVQLTTGDTDYAPTVTPDSRWILYQNPAIQKISIDGGEPTQLTSKNNGMVQISPDGEFISVKYLTDQNPLKYRLAILPITGGEPVKIFDRSVEAWKWVGDSIIYADYQGENVNLFSHSLKTDQIKQITNFTNDKILSFALSKDGKQIVLIRGSITNEAVVIKNFR